MNLAYLFGQPPLHLCRQHRSALFYAILSENIEMTKFMLEKAPAAVLEAKESVWGWTVIHGAASK